MIREGLCACQNRDSAKPKLMNTTAVVLVALDVSGLTWSGLRALKKAPFLVSEAIAGGSGFVLLVVGFLMMAPR